MTAPASGERPNAIMIELPEWIDGRWRDAKRMKSVEERMAFAIELATLNVADGGGPFGAAIFTEDGDLIAPGINRVVPASAPIAHAEMVAIALAGQTLGTWEIGRAGGFELVSTTEPCAMCLGAVPWSGVSSLVCGARDSDARAVGFDEGHKPHDWVTNLESQGISVTQDIMRAEAGKVLSAYVSDGGAVYNGAGEED